MRPRAPYLWWIGAAIMLLLCAVQGTVAQLNEHCTVSVLNRNVRVNPDGSWVLPNVPANFGQVRARATCVQNGVTTSGESTFFTIPANGIVNLPEIVLGAATPIPVSLSITPARVSFTAVGQTSQLAVTATYPGGSVQDVTAATTGTNYTTSNPAIVTVGADGLVTAVAIGTVVIQATNDGAAGIVTAMVALSSIDTDGDGIPDDVELALGLNPNNPIDAQEDFDRDGLTNLAEIQRGTDLRNPDTDSDGLPDGREVALDTSPLLTDTDGDGIRDGLEVQTGSNPLDPASFNLARALASLAVTPATFTLIFNTIIGEASQQLTVTGTLIDGTTLNLTSTSRGTNYSSSDLTVCNFGAPDGRVFAGANGTCIVTVSNSGFAQPVNVVVQTFTPQPLAFVNIPRFANNVDVNGNFAYVAAGPTGLQVVNVSDRRAPTVIAALDTPGNAQDVKVVGNTAFVGDGPAGLQIIDITDPLQPRHIGAVNTPGNAQGVVVQGNLVFVADGASGLQVINVSDPTAPVILRTVDTPGDAQGVDVHLGRRIAVVADGVSGLHVIDLANTASPVIVDSIDTGNAQNVSLAADGTFALVADLERSLTAVDISDPRNPVIRASTPANTGGLLVDVALSDRFAFGADIFFVNGVPIVDVSIPEAPIPRAILDFRTFRDDNGTGIAVDGSFVYLTAAVGSSTRLYIGQYLAQEDRGGIPPIVAITTPAPGETVIEGARVPITVEAADDITVVAVTVLVDGQAVSTDTSAPYQFTFTVPTGVSRLTLGATAVDLAGNLGVASDVVVNVIPDPLTTVVGVALDPDGVPIQGATVSTAGGRSGMTSADGSFSISDVPTILGDIIVQAVVIVNGDELQGRSAPVPPVSGSVTDVGIITLVAFQGFALHFDGINDMVTFGTVPTVSQHTIEAWVKPGSLNDGVIVGHIAGPGAACGFGMMLSGGGSTLCYDLDPAGCGTSNFICHQSGTLGVWTHLAGTFDGNVGRLYVNGQLVNERAGVSFTASNWMTAGALSFFNGPQQFYTGEIDEIRIWNFPRSAQEILDTMHRSLTGSEPGLVGYWKMDEGSGQQVGDSSPVGITGVLGSSSDAQSSDPVWVESQAPIQ